MDTHIAHRRVHKSGVTPTHTFGRNVCIGQDMSTTSTTATCVAGHGLVISALVTRHETVRALILFRRRRRRLEAKAEEEKHWATGKQGPLKPHAFVAISKQEQTTPLQRQPAASTLPAHRNPAVSQPGGRKATPTGEAKLTPALDQLSCGTSTRPASHGHTLGTLESGKLGTCPL